MYDVLIAGGGPVGLAAALHATRLGLKVAIWEPREGVLDKACGEGLMPGALRALAELDVEPAGIALAGIRYLDGHRSAEARFRSGPGRGVRRTALHGALRAAVLAAGIPIELAGVHAVEQHTDRVRVNGVPARYLVAADGLRSPVRAMLGLDARVRGPRRYGQRAHVALTPWTEFVEVHWAPRSEAYATPVAPDLVGIALLTSHRAPFDELLAEHRALRERVAGSTRSRVAGAGPLRRRSSRRVTGRVLLVGDASGYVDALTGEGIALGLAHARSAIQAIALDEPQRYERAWRRLGRPQRLLTQTLLTATRPAAARRLIVPAAARLPGVFEAAVGMLAD